MASFAEMQQFCKEQQKCPTMTHATYANVIMAWDKQHNAPFCVRMLGVPLHIVKECKPATQRNTYRRPILFQMSIIIQPATPGPSIATLL